MKKAGKIIKNILFSLIVLVLLTAAVAIPIVTEMFGAYRDSVLDLSAYGISTSVMPTKLYLYDSEGNTREYAELSTVGQRIPVKYADFPKNLVNAFVSIEDKRFWKHRGVDFFRTFEAAANYLFNFKGEFGASTITQQLIKNATGDNMTTPDRKLREIFRAAALEKQADKTAILEAYLNIINLSDGCIGVGAAALRYFGKSVGELTLSECASIAAITNNPARYNPKTNPENNRARRDLILRSMLDQGYVTESECEAAISDPVDTQNGVGLTPEAVNSWYTDTVIEDVKNDLMIEYGYTERQAISLIYNGGLAIYTAQNQEVQEAVDRYFLNEDNFPTGENGRPQAAIVIIDPKSGDVLALSGGVGEKKGNRIQNRAAYALHSPGSSIKPISVYAPAIDRGIINWATVYDDSPVGTAYTKSGVARPWPENGDKIYRGPVDVDYAISASFNTVAVKVLCDLGVKNSFDFMKNRLKITSLVDESEKINDVNPVSLALGQLSHGLTVREITAAYTSLYDGVYRKPITYYRVLDTEGRVLLSNSHNGEVVLTSETASITTKLLENTVEKGTARGIKIDRYVDVAGKTGTTQDNCDRWFIGYTPEYIAGVWVGYDYPKPLDGIVGNPCITAWDNVMYSVYRGRKSGYQKHFDVSPSVGQCSYCRETGGLPSDECFSDGSCKIGWFTSETLPKNRCQYPHTAE